MNGDKLNNDKSEYFDHGPYSNEDTGNERCEDPNTLSACMMPQSGHLDCDSHQDRQIQECLEKSGQTDKHVRSNLEHRTVVEYFASDEESGESVVYGSSDESNDGVGSIRCKAPKTDPEIQEQGILFRKYFGSNNKCPSNVSTNFKSQRTKYKNNDDTSKNSKNEETMQKFNMPHSSHSLNISQEMPSTSIDHIFHSQENLKKSKTENLLNFESSYDKETTEDNSLGQIIPSNSVSPSIQCRKSSSEWLDVPGSSDYGGHFTVNLSQSLKYYSKEVPVAGEYEDTIHNLNQAILAMDLNMNSSSNDNFSESLEMSPERINVSDFDSSQENKNLPDIVRDVYFLSCPDSSRDNIRNVNESSDKLDLPRLPVCGSHYTTKESSKLSDCSGLTISPKRAQKDYYRNNSSLAKASSTSELHSSLNDDDCNVKGMSVSNLLALPHRKFRSTNLAPVSELNSSSKCKAQHLKKSRSLELTARSSHSVQNVDGCNVLESSASPRYQTKRTKGFSVLDLSNSINYVPDHLDLSLTVCSKYTQRKHKSFHLLNLSDSSSDETTSTNSQKRREHKKRKKSLSFCSSDSKLVISNSELCNKANGEGILSISDSHKLLKRQYFARSIKIEKDPLSIIHESKFSINLKLGTSEENRTSRKRLVSQSKISEMEKLEEGKENKKFKRSRSTEKQ